MPLVCRSVKKMRFNAFQMHFFTFLVTKRNRDGFMSPTLHHYTGAEFATKLAQTLQKEGTSAWVATLDIRVGENWREAQAQALLRACAHLVVLDDNMVRQNVLRTEILLSEARGLPTFGILSPRLDNDPSKIENLLNGLDSSDQTYRRLAATEYFSCAHGLDKMLAQLVKRLMAGGKGSSIAAARSANFRTSEALKD